MIIGYKHYRKQQLTNILSSGGRNASILNLFINLNFVARLEFSAKNPARTAICQTLPATLKKTLQTIKLWQILLNMTLKRK